MSPAPALKVRTVEVFDARLPLRRPFSHNLATHQEARPQVVRLTLSDGVQGYGEAQPRPYLTGETLESVNDALVGPLGEWVMQHPMEGLEGAVERLSSAEARQLKEHQPAAFCGLELALLDAMGRSANRSVVEVLGHVQRRQLPYDGAVISFLPSTVLGLYLRQVRQQGKKLIKLKVGREDDVERLTAVRRALGPDVAVMLDANGAWSPDEAIRQILRMEPLGLAAVEQPVARDDIEGMARVRRAVRTPLMADESLCTDADARRLLEAGACELWNLRVGKCGGLLATQALLQLAEAQGIRCSLGVLVGETAILGRAGQLLAACAPELWTLERDTSGSMQAGSGIPLLPDLKSNHAEVENGLPGLGLRIDAEQLEASAVARRTLGSQKVKQP